MQDQAASGCCLWAGLSKPPSQSDQTAVEIQTRRARAHAPTMLLTALLVAAAAALLLVRP